MPAERICKMLKDLFKDANVRFEWVDNVFDSTITAFHGEEKIGDFIWKPINEADAHAMYDYIISAVKQSLKLIKKAQLKELVVHFVNGSTEKFECIDYTIVEGAAKEANIVMKMPDHTASVVLLRNVLYFNLSEYNTKEIGGI